MARKIIVLENQNPGRSGGDPIAYRYAFWLDVPVARRPFFANASATSAVKDATAGELSAIQSGAVKEVVDTFSYPDGSTLAQIQAGLVALYNASQSALNSSAANPYDHYGTSWDGNAWTISTVG